MAEEMLTPYTWTIDELFKNNIHTVPVYQRPYSWGSEQVTMLLDDIFESYNSKDSFQGYYIGNMILHDKNELIGNGHFNKYYVIDGQQRITTFMLVMLDLYSICSRRDIANDQEVLNLKECIWKKIGRTYDKGLPSLTLNSIEKECFKEIVDVCFDNPNKFIEQVKKIKVTAASENHLLENLFIINDRFENEFSNVSDDALILFVQYVLDSLKFIVVRCKYNESKVFGMFESINSKAKPLEDIDLIKTAIFYELDESSYDIYLKKWGQLIIETNDRLYDYFSTYIKAFVVYYRYSIKHTNFKSTVSWKLQEYFGCNTLCDAYKCLIDDMVSKVKYYKMLDSVDEAKSLIHSDKFRFYYRIFVGAYYHPKPLFMRAFFEYEEKHLSKNDVVEIVAEIVKFMLYSGIASKDMIGMFAAIMDDTYTNNMIDKNLVIARIVNELKLHGITKNIISEKLHSMYTYDKNKNTTKALLTLCESIDVINGKKMISYDKADLILDKFEEAFSLDHLLVQRPDKNDSAYSYYAEKNSEGIEVLRLKASHDFPQDTIRDGMIYDDFVRTVLHKLGNLRIYYRDKNTVRQNKAIDLGEFCSFHTYKEIIDRENALIDTIMTMIFDIPQVDVSLLDDICNPKSNYDLKVKDLIDAGKLAIGDELVIKDMIGQNKAVLLDASHVEYNGEKMRINEWAKRCLGWKSVRIYTYVCKASTMETLDVLRKSIVMDEG